MKLTDIALSASEVKAQTEPSSVLKDQPRYPWGLGLNLDNTTLEKLGLDGKMPDVGETYMLTARVKVTGCSANDTEGGGKNRSCSLQIVAMALGEDDSESKDAKDVLYK